MKFHLFVYVNLLLILTSCNNQSNENINLVIGKSDNSMINEVGYKSDLDKSFYRILFDTMGVPTGFEFTDSLGNKSQFEIGRNSNPSEVNIISMKENEIKEFKFHGNKLVEINNYTRDPSNVYTLNEWRYLDKHENIIQDEGFFLEISIDDTIYQKNKKFAKIGLKGGKGLKGVACCVDGKRILTNDRQFEIPLNTDNKGLQELKGYVLNFDTVFKPDGSWMVNELKIRFKKEFLVQ